VGILDGIRRLFRGGSETTERGVALTELRSATTVTQLDGTEDPAWTFTFMAGATRPMDVIEASLWAYACGREVATKAGSVPLLVRLFGDLVPEHPLQQLLNTPAPGWTRSRLVEDMAYNLQFTGSSYLEKRRSIANGGTPAELWSWGETQVTTSMESSDSPVAAGYRKNVGDGGFLSLDDVVRTLFVRPGCFDRGLSPAEPAQHEIAIDRQATGWQRTAFSNRGVPDGIFASTQYLSDDQFAEAEERLADKWTGLANAHRPFILGSDVKWLDLAKSAVELEFMEGRAFTKKAICSAFGVPDTIFEGSGATFANLEVALTLLWSTVGSMMDSIVESLNTQLAPDYGEGVTIEADIDTARARGIPIKERWAAAVPAIDGGVPWSQISRIFSLGLEEWPGWDEPRAGTESATDSTEANNATPHLEVIK
jgi:HK97 family phage portal protein